MGRPRGSKNKSTPAKRVFWQAFLDANESKVQALFDALAATDPKAAIDVLLRASPYVYPQLGRQEIAGGDGVPLTVVIKRETAE